MAKSPQQCLKLAQKEAKSRNAKKRVHEMPRKAKEGLPVIAARS